MQPDGTVDLFCLLGMTPQVVVEALAALAVRGSTVHDLTLYTTDGVRDVGTLAIDIGSDGIARPGPRLEELCGHVPHARPTGAIRCVAFPSTDPRDDKGLRDLGRHLDGSLRDAIRRAGARPVVACLSGGRKTMSAWLTLSVALRARRGDRLVHVLVPEELEDRDIWPPRKGHPEDLEAIVLGELPYPRLSGLIPGAREPNIDALIGVATRRADEHGPLRVVEDEAHLEVWLGERKLALPAQPATMLALYAERGGEVAWLALTEAERTRLEHLYQKARGRGSRDGLKIASEGLELDDVLIANTNLRKALRKAAPGLDVEIRSDGAKTTGRFCVVGCDVVLEQRS